MRTHKIFSPPSWPALHHPPSGRLVATVLACAWYTVLPCTYPKTVPPILPRACLAADRVRSSGFKTGSTNSVLMMGIIVTMMFHGTSVDH